MAKADQIEIRLRITVEQPVPGLLYSLQAKEDGPLDPKRSDDGSPLSFDFVIRVGPGPKFFGDQVRREGPERRFVYLRIGQAAGDHTSPYNGRIKVDIHDIDQKLLDSAADDARVIETVINGTGRNGGPAYATVRPVARRLA